MREQTPRQFSICTNSVDPPQQSMMSARGRCKGVEHLLSVQYMMQQRMKNRQSLFN